MNSWILFKAAKEIVVMKDIIHVLGGWCLPQTVRLEKTNYSLSPKPILSLLMVTPCSLCSNVLFNTFEVSSCWDFCNFWEPTSLLRLSFLVSHSFTFLTKNYFHPTLSIHVLKFLDAVFSLRGVIDSIFPRKTSVVFFS